MTVRGWLSDPITRRMVTALGKPRRRIPPILVRPEPPAAPGLVHRHVHAHRDLDISHTHDHTHRRGELDTHAGHALFHQERR